MSEEQTEVTGAGDDIINGIIGKIKAVIQESGAHEDYVVSALVACLSEVIVGGATPNFNIEMRFMSAVDLISTYIRRYDTVNGFSCSTSDVGIH